MTRLRYKFIHHHLALQLWVAESDIHIHIRRLFSGMPALISYFFKSFRYKSFTIKYFFCKNKTWITTHNVFLVALTSLSKRPVLVRLP